jgi:hypothetical protein
VPRHFALSCAALGLRAGDNELTFEIRLRTPDAPQAPAVNDPFARPGRKGTAGAVESAVSAPVRWIARRRLMALGGAPQLAHLRLEVRGVSGERSAAYMEALDPGLSVAASSTVVLHTDEAAQPEARGAPLAAPPPLRLTIALTCDVCGRRSACPIVTAVAHATTTGRVVAPGGLRAPLSGAAAELAACASRGGHVLVTVLVASEALAETMEWSAGRLGIDPTAAPAPEPGPRRGDRGVAPPCDRLPSLQPEPGPSARVPSGTRLLSVGVTTTAVCAAFARLVFKVHKMVQLGGSPWTPALIALSVGSACVLAAFIAAWVSQDIHYFSVAVLALAMMPTVFAGRAFFK